MTGGKYRLATAIKATGEYTPPGASRPTRVNPAESVVQALSFGTGPGEVVEVIDLSFVLDGGTSRTLNMADGSLTNVLGISAPLAKLRSFAAWVASGGDSAGVKVAPGASNGNSLWWGGTTPTKTIYPLGPPELGGSGDGVTVSTAAANVTFTNLGGTSATVRVALAGLSAMGSTWFPGANLLRCVG